MLGLTLTADCNVSRQGSRLALAKIPSKVNRKRTLELISTAGTGVGQRGLVSVTAARASSRSGRGPRSHGDLYFDSFLPAFYTVSNKLNAHARWHDVIAVLGRIWLYLVT